MNKKNIYKFLDNKRLINHKITDVKFAQVIAGRIVYTYSKLIIKRLNLETFNKYSQPICPNYSVYLWNSTGIILRAKKIFETNKTLLDKIYIMQWPKSGCKEIDIITERFIKKNFQLKVTFINSYRKKLHNKKNLYKVRTIGITNYLRDFLLIYRRVNNHKKIKKFKNKNKILLISHHKKPLIEPYNFLEKKLREVCKTNDLMLIQKTSDEFGINMRERFLCIFKTIQIIFNHYYKFKTLKLSDMHFIFFFIATKSLENNIAKFYKENSIISVSTTYIDWLRLDRFFRACKKVNIKFLHYDYSMGYPFTKGELLRYGPDTRKYADIIFANSEFRRSQYVLATRFLEKKPKVILHPCPQIAYCDQKKLKTNKKNISQKKQIKLALVDNCVNLDDYLQEIDIKSFSEIVSKFPKKFKFIMQSKHAKNIHLENTKNNFEFIFNNVRGDFRLIRQADLICSLGFQGTALKAASLYKKPLMFYTYNSFETEIALFSLDKHINNQITRSLSELWFNKFNLEKALNLIEDENFIRKIYFNTELLLEGIGIEKQSSINNFFKEYYID